MSVGRERPWRLLLLVAALNAAVLVLTAGRQIYDTNFYSLWESTALLAGDHPYRDFFEWGVPLQAAVSLCAQVLVGNRLIGEFAVQWIGIIAGAVISFHLGLRASRSIAASTLMMAVTVALLADTAIYHYPKLLLYPLGTWVMWRYLDAPSVRRAAMIGVIVAAAFLFRHDHGVYVAGAAAFAFVLARVAAPRSRSIRASFVDGGTFAATGLALLAPWLVLVHTSEGLPQYVESRLQRYAQGSPYSNPYASLLTINPLRPLTPDDPPPPDPGLVSFEWLGHIDDAERQRLADASGLRPVAGPDADGRWQYEVDDRNDPRLLQLDASVNNSDGIDWPRLADLRWRLPHRDRSVAWLQQTALLVPLLLLIAAGFDVLRSRRLKQPLPDETHHVVVAAALLAIVDWRLFREPAYMTAVAPLTAALAARLVSTTRSGHAVGGIRGFRRLWAVVRAAVVAIMVAVTAFAAFNFARGSGIFTPWRLAADVPDVFTELMASPPIEGFAPLEDVVSRDRSSWNEEEVDAVRVLLRYIHDCAAPGDRVLVTGQTPFQVGYYVERPIAGGHLFWHEGFRSDPARERQSLALLRRQSVPFAYSTHDPVFDDLKRYPRIQAYMKEHYRELPGSRGLVLVDARRTPTGVFGQLGFPCFR
ncbi:MAG: hypothetical protein HY655_08425 [Acidobacteria bacterium]|nr:hypothetical protein [Acidobacteriota bacterium]